MFGEYDRAIAAVDMIAQKLKGAPQRRRNSPQIGAPQNPALNPQQFLPHSPSGNLEQVLQLAPYLVVFRVHSLSVSL